MKHAIGVLRYVAFFGLILLASAGTLAWPRAWILLGVLLIVHGGGTWSILRVNRALLDDRAKLPLRRDQAPADKVLLPASMLSFALLVSFDGFDAFRVKVLGSPGGVVSAIGLALFAGGWCLVEAALRTNAFATTVVRHQADRGHVVVSTGVYKVCATRCTRDLSHRCSGWACGLGPMPECLPWWCRQGSSSDESSSKRRSSAGCFQSIRPINREFGADSYPVYGSECSLESVLVCTGAAELADAADAAPVGLVRAF